MKNIYHEIHLNLIDRNRFFLRMKEKVLRINGNQPLIDFFINNLYFFMNECNN